MGDAPARTELKVTTGPIRGSRKIHAGGLRVAMRAVDLEPSSGEPPVVLYDTSGPYTDPDARIDLTAGLAPLRTRWIEERGDTEVLPQLSSAFGRSREHDPRLAEVRFPGRLLPRRARAGANVSQRQPARSLRPRLQDRPGIRFRRHYRFQRRTRCSDCASHRRAPVRGSDHRAESVASCHRHLRRQKERAPARMRPVAK